MEVLVFKDKKEVAHKFAAFFKDLVSGEDVMHIALSGGSTPKIVFDLLASEYKNAIAWEHIHFYWGDERCVLPTDEQSNFKMTTDHLFSKITIPKENIHRILGENDPLGEAMRYANLLEINLDRVDEIPQFDLLRC